MWIANAGLDTTAAEAGGVGAGDSVLVGGAGTASGLIAVGAAGTVSFSGASVVRVSSDFGAAVSAAATGGGAIPVSADVWPRAAGFSLRSAGGGGVSGDAAARAAEAESGLVSSFDSKRLTYRGVFF